MPPATTALIVANVAVFLLQSIAPGVAYPFALWPLGASASGMGASFGPWQLVTYAFLHGGLVHLAFNMFALYMFGGELERVFGPQRYLNLYFIAVITAALTQLVFAGVSGGEPYPTVGASGGIFGLLLAYGMYFPRRMILLLIPPIPMPASVFVIVYGVLELYLGVTGTQEGVAHFAHLGGMLGAWFVIRHWRGRPPSGRR